MQDWPIEVGVFENQGVFPSRLGYKFNKGLNFQENVKTFQNFMSFGLKLKKIRNVSENF